MIRNACAIALAMVLLAGCQGAGPKSTEAMEVKQMRVNGVDLAYVEEGRGETIVFVHGALGDWRTWERVRPWVSPKYRYVSFSRRLHHPNAWTDDGGKYDFNQHVEDLAAFIRALNAGKVHLVGNSYSGRMAGTLALKYPELLRSVVLGDSSLAFPSSPESKAALAAFRNDMARSSAAAKAGDAQQAAIFLFDSVNQPNTFAKVSPGQQQRWLDNAKTVVPLFTATAAAPVSCEALAAVKVPVMVMGGALSRDFYRLGNAALLQCLPAGSESFQVPNAHHIWPAENPEAGARAILSFVAKH